MEEIMHTTREQQMKAILAVFDTQFRDHIALQIQGIVELQGLSIVLRTKSRNV